MERGFVIQHTLPTAGLHIAANIPVHRVCCVHTNASVWWFGVSVVVVISTWDIYSLCDVVLVLCSVRALHVEREVLYLC